MKTVVLLGNMVLTTSRTQEPTVSIETPSSWYMRSRELLKELNDSPDQNATQVTLTASEMKMLELLTGKTEIAEKMSPTVNVVRINQDVLSKAQRFLLNSKFPTIDFAFSNTVRSSKVTHIQSDDKVDDYLNLIYVSAEDIQQILNNNRIEEYLTNNVSTDERYQYLDDLKADGLAKVAMKLTGFADMMLFNGWNGICSGVIENAMKSSKSDKTVAFKVNKSKSIYKGKVIDNSDVPSSIRSGKLLIVKSAVNGNEEVVNNKMFDLVKEGKLAHLGLLPEHARISEVRTNVTVESISYIASNYPFLRALATNPSSVMMLLV